MSFRPAWFPCSDMTPHDEHQHTDGPDSYMYTCAGKPCPCLEDEAGIEVKAGCPKHDPRVALNQL